MADLVAFGSEAVVRPDEPRQHFKMIISERDARLEVRSPPTTGGEAERASQKRCSIHSR
jgi:hypothetical protein